MEGGARRRQAPGVGRPHLSHQRRCLPPPPAPGARGPAYPPAGGVSKRAKPEGEPGPQSQDGPDLETRCRKGASSGQEVRIHDRAREVK